MAIDCFFAVWFVVGNVWIFGGHSSPSDSPKLYRYTPSTSSALMSQWRTEILTCMFFFVWLGLAGYA